MAKPIMIQGTMSNAGKSILAAGLCRIFKQDGYRTAPFKSQNMALNSYITSEGPGDGRVVVQAGAAGISPHVDMNPILLKPTTDVGFPGDCPWRCQGEHEGQDYFCHETQPDSEIMSSYERLSGSHDIIVIEGAGSPAEINLKSDDIVNMGLAEQVDAPVLLAGDIDRGGVFALQHRGPFRTGGAAAGQGAYHQQIPWGQIHLDPKSKDAWNSFAAYR